MNKISSEFDYMIALMEEAVLFSLEHVQNGGIPFTAFVVNAAGIVIGRGVNRVSQHHDPTAHAEIEAIRDACRAQTVSNLRGTTLLASGEPCAMCYISALYSGVSRLFYAVDRNEVATHGFDYRGSYSYLASDPHNWSSFIVQKLPVSNRLQPFLQFSNSLFC